MMRRLIQITLVAGLLGAAWTLSAQLPLDHPDVSPFPGLKREQVLKILKDEHKKSVEDAAELLKLSKSLKQELDEADYSVVSLKAIKNAEKIEKLAKQIRSRMSRY